MKIQPQRRIYDPALRANCGEMKNVSRQVSCSGLWKAQELLSKVTLGPCTPAFKSRVTNTSSSLYRNGKLPQEMTGKEKFLSPLLLQDFTLQENSYREIFFPVFGFSLSFLPIHVVVDPVVTAAPGEIRQQLTMTLKNMLMLRKKRSKLVGLFYFFFPEELLKNKDTAHKICASKNIPCRQLQQLQTSHPNC